MKVHTCDVARAQTLALRGGGCTRFCICPRMIEYVLISISNRPAFQANYLQNLDHIVNLNFLRDVLILEIMIGFEVFRSQH